MPPNGANPVVKVPAFWRKDWSSGIKIIGTENSELPLVTLNIKIPGGHLLNANDLSKAGLASIFTDMMNEDTKKFSAEEISRELQKLGSTINVFSDNDNISFQVQSQKKNIDATLALLQERMFNPKFTQAAFDRIKKQNLESFKVAKSQPASVASDVYAKLNYGPNHILGINANGNEETEKTFTLADVQYYYDNYMTSQGTQVVIVGDISQDEILPKLSFLNNLPNKKITIPTVTAAPAVEKTKIYLVDVPKAAQTEFRVGYVTGLKYDATGEYFKAGLMNYILGGAFNSRLNLNLREDKGWTYGARSGFAGGKQTGDFTFSAGIRANATDSAMIEIMKEMKNYEETGITEEELAFMKSSIGQRDALRFETGFQKAGFIGNILDNNLPADYVDQQNKIVASITKTEIDALAKKWITEGRMNVLVVGDKAKILPGLQKLGYEIIELDVDGKPVEKKAF
jgi:zinc protease